MMCAGPALVIYVVESDGKLFFFFFMGNTQNFYSKRCNEDTSFAHPCVVRTRPA